MKTNTICSNSLVLLKSSCCGVERISSNHITKNEFISDDTGMNFETMDMPWRSDSEFFVQLVDISLLIFAMPRLLY